MNDSWVIDSGASDHMNWYVSFIFLYIILVLEEKKVRIAYSHLSLVSGKGSIYVTPPMISSSVLHVPDFVANLLSIARITL